MLFRSTPLLESPTRLSLPSIENLLLLKERRLREIAPEHDDQKLLGGLKLQLSLSATSRGLTTESLDYRSLSQA